MRFSRFLMASLLILALCVPALGASYDKFWIQVQDEYGDARTDFVSVNVLTVGTDTSATVYAAETGGSKTNPILLSATSNGVATWCSATSSFDVEITFGEQVVKVEGVTVNDHKIVCLKEALPIDRLSILERFEVNPLTSLITGGAAGGSAGDENVMAFGLNNFEYHILGTQTITAMSLYDTDAVVGLSVSMDLTDDDGVEMGRGITKESPEAFVVGTSPAFYIKVKLLISDVSGTDDCAIGFRTAEAYQANIDDYANMAALNVISGSIYCETIDDSASTTTTDTTDDWADEAQKTLEVYVSAAGVVTYKVNGSAPTTVAAFTIDDAEVVVPFFYFLHDTDLAEGTLIEKWEVGLQ